jgi:hypothetical protein
LLALGSWLLNLDDITSQQLPKERLMPDTMQQSSTSRLPGRKQDTAELMASYQQRKQYIQRHTYANEVLGGGM